MFMVVLRLSLVKGSSPVSISNINTPKLHQSAAWSWPVRLTTSGAMYSTVPQNENALPAGRVRSKLLERKKNERGEESQERRVRERERETHTHRHRHTHTHTQKPRHTHRRTVLLLGVLLAETKVSERYVAVLVKQDVLRLEVAVDNAWLGQQI
jgi:hypothetical protein